MLLANHGILAFGSSVEEAARIIIVLDEAALMTLAAQSLGGDEPFPPGAVEEVCKRMTAFGMGARIGPR